MWFRLFCGWETFKHYWWKGNAGEEKTGSLSRLKGDGQQKFRITYENKSDSDLSSTHGEGTMLDGTWVTS